MSNIYFQKENKKEEEPLALLNLEVQKGIIKQIKFYKNSNSEELAYNFCKENKIDFLSMAQIKNEIESLIQKYFNSYQNEKKLENLMIENNNIYNSKPRSSQRYDKKSNNSLNDEFSYYKYNNNSKNNISNNKGNLFFYEFLQKEQKKRKPFLSKSNSVNILKTKVFNTINTTSKYSNRKRLIGSGSGSHIRINDYYLTKNINTNDKNSNIFSRLYSDAKIKKVVYKRPCHYRSNSKEKRGFQDDGNNIYETINGKSFNKMTIDMSPSYIRSYQIKPYQILNKECSFHPNSKLFSIQTNNINNLNLMNIPENRDNNNYLKNTKTNGIKYHKFKRKLYSNNNENNNNDNPMFNQHQNNILYEENYVPLKNKIKFYPKLEENNHLNIIDNKDKKSLEAFNNLFDKLTNNDQSHILNKNTLNINNIDNNSVLILSNIIKDINNNDIELNLENFINRLFIELSNEDKKIIILNYSNTSTINSNYKRNKIKNDNNHKIEVNKQPLLFMNNYGYNQNKNDKLLEKMYKANTSSNFNKSYRISSGAEKKKNFYYL